MSDLLMSGAELFRRTEFRLAALLSSALLAGTGCGAAQHWQRSTTERNEPMNREIAALLETYERSLNEGNAELVKSLYTDDAVFIGAPFPTTTGKDAIVALYADFLSKLDFNVRFEVLEMELADGLGFIRTKSVGTIVPKGQTPSGSEGNRELFVVKKVNGKWLFHRYIFNPELASAAAP